MVMFNDKGKLVYICGIDGSGKTTQTRMLWNHFVELGIKTFYVPKIPSFGYWVYHCLLTSFESNSVNDLISNEDLHLIECVDMIRHFNNYIEKILSFETIVISEYTPITYLARAMAQNASNFDKLKLIYSVCPKPDTIIYLDINEAVALDRVDKRGFEKDSIDKLINLDNAYKCILKDFRVLYLDADDTIQNVSQKITEYVIQQLEVKVD